VIAEPKRCKAGAAHTMWASHVAGVASERDEVGALLILDECNAERTAPEHPLPANFFRRHPHMIKAAKALGQRVSMLKSECWLTHP